MLVASTARLAEASETPLRIALLSALDSDSQERLAARFESALQALSAPA
jgi:hypothetical protein